MKCKKKQLNLTDNWVFILIFHQTPKSLRISQFDYL